MPLRPLTRCTVICATFFGLSTAVSQAATLTHNYELNGTYTDALGGPSLVDAGGTLSGTDYTFTANQGLSLSSAIDPNTYSIEMAVSLSTTTGYRKLIDFKDLTSDTGLYNLNTGLVFYNASFGAAGAIPTSTLSDVVITRDGGTDTVVGYVNGVQQFSFTDGAGLGIFSGTNNIIQFAKDDFATGQNEASGGLIDRIRIFDGALTSTEVNDLYVNGLPESAVPEPSQTASLAFGSFGVLALLLRARKRRVDA